MKGYYYDSIGEMHTLPSGYSSVSEGNINREETQKEKTDNPKKYHMIVSELLYLLELQNDQIKRGEKEKSQEKGL